jgi:cytochrome P450
MLRSPPICKTVPIVGELPFLLRKKLDHLVDLRAREGDIFTVDLGVVSLVCLCHPKYAQHVLRDNVKNYPKSKGLGDGLRRIIGNSLPASEGSFWRRQRRMMQPHFHREALAQMAELMVDAIDEELETWDAHARSGQAFDLAFEMTRITLRVLVKTIFGSDIEQRQSDLVGREMRYTLDYMLYALAMVGVPKWVPVPGRKRFHEAISNIDALLFDLIAKRQKGQSRAGGTLIDMLTSAVDADTNERMTPREMRDEAVAMFLAGFETTSTAVSFAFRELNARPEMRADVLGEVDSVLGGRRPTVADLRKLPRCLAFLQETMRIYPSAYWLSRTAMEDDIIDGYLIRRGQEVGILSHVIHRHPDFWPDPLRFDPNRFLPEAVQGRHSLAWIPFGAGQRICIGKEFAMMEAQFILARILAKYDVRPAYQPTSTVHVNTLLRPGGGVWVRVTKRTKN